MTDLSRPSIAVIGAGPGGLLAARVLQLGGVDVTVYDADASCGSRDQGGTLDLHADSGQIALEDANLTAEFAAVARPEGQAHRLLDPQGTVLVEQTPAPGETAAPEVDRAQLRGMLAESLIPGTIRWWRRLVSAHQGTLTFEDGGVETVDLVIGADGAWSRVRAALTDAAPTYTGVTFVEALFTNVTRRHPEVAALVGDGHMWANGDGKTLVLQRNSGDVVRGYISFRAELDWLAEAGLGAAAGRGGVLDPSGTIATDTEQVRAALRRRFAEFSPELLRVIDDTEGTLPNRPIFALPTPTTWAHQSGITLLGDAAHVMSPFGGNGVNLALLDGAELARGIVSAVRTGTAIDDAVRAYEERMVPRGAAMGKAANDAIAEHYAVGGPDLDSIPDFDEAAEQWRTNAAEYRANQN
ncbi:FAD-dependent oxidoreductase [Leifsonia poae]|uniref:FAD-dependent oxidoreductase n=1 Tax=Leifsonia poae TaxID=110933 RepID=UPI001CBBFDA2|nr:NAD(P)/FAD-dependent oxidoreductase [Leifsonia poae]